jgi:hypothetical protein
MAKEKHQKNPAAVALGALGGRARARKLTKKRRQEISALGNATRWGKVRRKAATP